MIAVKQAMRYTRCHMLNHLPTAPIQTTSTCPVSSALVRNCQHFGTFVLVVLSSCQLAAAEADFWATARHQLVDREIVAAGIQNQNVIDAMRHTPRHEFVPHTHRRKAYFDMALPIGGNQTISPPYVVAYMTEQLDPKPTDKVLEIGTGSGYQAAVLSRIVDQVYSIEIVESLGRRAASTLRRLGYDNVHTRIGDGFQGWPEHAPFEKIIVTCSPEEVPQPLVEQLTEGGQMIVPVGERFQQSLYRFTKVDNQLQREHLQSTFFVPMTGEAESARRVIPDLTTPEIAHESFEDTLDKSDLPRGWYYVRQGRVAEDATAPDGSLAMLFSNRTAGRNAHAMQAFGVDGRDIKKIEFSMWVQATDVRPGRLREEQAGVIVEFYGKNRAPVGFEHQGNWHGTFDWTKKELSLRVPPSARLGVIGIGLFGATGEVRFDAVTVQATVKR